MPKQILVRQVDFKVRQVEFYLAHFWRLVRRVEIQNWSENFLIKYLNIIQKPYITNFAYNYIVLAY